MVLYFKFDCWLGRKDDSGSVAVSPQSTGLPTLNQEASRPFWVPVPSSESRAPAAPSAGGRAATPGLPPHSGLPSTAGSTKYFGTAKVRYDFCARDRSELNLKEGDIVKILNKKGQQGWWRGEIYGRVSRGGGGGGAWQPRRGCWAALASVSLSTDGRWCPRSSSRNPQFGAW